MRRVLGGIVLLALGGAPALRAQLPSLPSGPPIRFSGEVGSLAELYRRSGAPGRRPGETGRVFLNADAVLFGSVTVGVNLIASTEDGTSLGYGGIPGRQSISQLGLHPRWSWGRAHLGAFSESYSPFTYNGVQVRGAGFDIQPGLLHVAAFGGHAASAVYGGASTGAYKRTITGGRLGLGRQAFGRPSTFVEVTAVRVWDDPNSLPAVDTTLPPNAPTPGVPTVINPYAVTPQENLVAALSGGLAFLRGALVWRGELASAVHTRDVRASELAPSVADVPGVVRGLITPRVGTHADHAISSELQLRRIRLPARGSETPGTLTASLAYRYVGAGYTALAVASQMSDVEALEARASVRFSRWSAQLQAGRQHDNLIGQKLATTTRSRLAGALSIRMSPVWSMNFRSNLLTMGNNSTDSLAFMGYSTVSFGMGHSFALGPRSRVQSVSLDYNYQTAGDANPRRGSAAFEAQSATARLAIRVSPDVQLSPNVGLTRSASDTLAPVTRTTYGVNVAWRLWHGRLTTSGAVGRSRYSRTGMWTVSLASTLHLTAQDDLVLGVQLNRYRDTATPLNAFDEQTVNLRWARRL